MKKFWLLPLLTLIILFGCQKSNNSTLDRTNLKKVEPVGLTEEQIKNIPINYEVPSLSEGLEALPFDLKPPKDYPFEALPLQMSSIEDFKHDGKDLRVIFTTFSKNKDDQVLLMITVHNFKVEYNGSGSEIKLADGVIGNYKGSSLVFEKDGIIYEVSYNNKNISAEQHKKEITDIANQML
jgi:hypothetical protein